MSRLDSFIRRMQAQRACLDWAVDRIAGRPGPVLELGLGNGRTYDHLREKLPGRDIYVFDRRVKAHPDCIPPDDRLFLGEVVDTLRLAGIRLGPTAVLIHTDLGTGDQAANVLLSQQISPLLPPLLAPGGFVVANHELFVSEWQQLTEPPGVSPGRYYLYRAPETGSED